MAQPIVSDARGTITPKTGLSRHRADQLWGLLFISPQLLGLLVFSIGPLLFALYISLTT